MNEEKLKTSIRFFDNSEVRAVWDEQYSKWWFSVVDVVGILNKEPDYQKTSNYWKYLKAKLKKENNQLVSATTQLKLTAADDKKYKTDMLDSEGIIELCKKSLLKLLFTYQNQVYISLKNAKLQKIKTILCANALLYQLA